MRIKVSRYVADKLDGLRKKDFKIQAFKASGPGGQHRNKVETAVRITHNETSISAEATDNKSQAKNKQEAFVRLAFRLIDHYDKEEKDERVVEVKDVGRIRTYNKLRHVVKDHRTGIEADYASVLDGNIDCFIEAMAGKIRGN